MTPDDMAPEVGAEYRHRRTGLLRRVSAWLPSVDAVILEKLDEPGRVKCSAKAFWQNHINAKARADDVETS